jgi:carboxyl-terminal processing protease
MKTLCVLLTLFATSSAGAQPKDSHDDYDDWKNKPREKFSDGERAFREVKETLLKEYVDDKLTDDDLWRAATAGMLQGAAGRKWDKLLSPGEYGELLGDLYGEMVGIGVEIKFDAEAGAIVILGAIPGSPAERAQLRGGDRVLKVDGRSFKGLQMRDAVYGMRGKIGQPVTLTILRDDQVLQKTIVRAPIVWAPVTDLMLPNDLALVTVKAFTDKTPGLLRAALQRVSQGKLRGLVIDVRANEGGNFERVIDCAGLLLPKGKIIVNSVHRGGKEEAIRSAGEPVVPGVPLAVLINGQTASGAEILAAALKQELGARLVGKKTFGKWNAQKVGTLPNKWAFKYTTGLFRTSRGESLDGKGLEPDLEIDQDEAVTEKAMRVHDAAARLAADAQLRAAVAILKLER